MINKEHESIEYRLKVMTAFANGETIEHLHIRGGEPGRNYKWVKDPDPIWNWYEYDYRVMPYPAVIPYKNAKEFFEAMKLHGPSLIHVRMSDTIVPIRADEENFYYFIPIRNSDAIAHYQQYSYRSASKDWIWQDGTVCGILKETNNE